MKFLVAAVILALALASAFAHVIIPKKLTLELYDPDIKHNGYCYAKQWSIGEMKSGEVRNVFEDHCREVTCKTDRTVTYEECPEDTTIDGRSNTKEVASEDKRKPFPQCCPKIVY